MADPRIPASTISGTSPPAVKADLKTLAIGINDALRSMTGMALHIVQSAMEAGDLLTKAKAAVAHGEWAQWLEVNCKLSDRTARRYMALAEGRGTIEAVMESKMATVADLTIRQAERLITKPKGNGASPVGAKSNGTTVAAAASELVETGGGNDPIKAVTAVREKLFTALNNLRRNDASKAEEAAKAIVKKLKELAFI